jgi:hypothetical protein
MEKIYGKGGDACNQSTHVCFSIIWCCINCEHLKKDWAVNGYRFVEPIEKIKKWKKHYLQTKIQVKMCELKKSSDLFFWKKTTMWPIFIF